MLSALMPKQASLFQSGVPFDSPFESGIWSHSYLA